MGVNVSVPETNKRMMGDVKPDAGGKRLRLPTNQTSPRKICCACGRLCRLAMRTGSESGGKVIFRPGEIGARKELRDFVFAIRQFRGKKPDASFKP